MSYLNGSVTFIVTYILCTYMVSHMLPVQISHNMNGLVMVNIHSYILLSIMVYGLTHIHHPYILLSSMVMVNLYTSR